MTKARQLGDKVWLAWCSAYHLTRQKCPMCFGKLYIKVITGDDKTHTLRCNECRVDDRPTGFTSQRSAAFGATLCEVSGIDLESDGNVRHKYRSKPSCSIGEFDTEQEALEAAEAAMPEAIIQAEQSNADIQPGKIQSVGWSVGYHQNQIRKLTRALEYHEKNLLIAKDRKKKKISKPKP